MRSTETVLSETNDLFFEGMVGLLNLYDLVECDRQLIREEMDKVHQLWADTVGEDLAVLDDRQAVEDRLCERMEAE